MQRTRAGILLSFTRTSLLFLLLRFTAVLKFNTSMSMRLSRRGYSARCQRGVAERVLLSPAAGGCGGRADLLG